MSIGKLTNIAVHGASSLALRWDDGHSAIVDVAGFLAERKALAPLRDSRSFAEAALSADGWSVEWPCGIDFGAPQLRRWADEQLGETMPAKAFRAWIKRHMLTQEKAADILGLSRRTIAYYLSGEQPIPKTVMLATEGVDARRAA